jgi:CheY-like chemotaxis protein
VSRLPRILLADDNENDKDLTCAALEAAGLANAVDWVKDGQACLDFLAAGNKPCVLLLDLKMPKVDGLQVLAKIKQDPSLQMLPVVMLTSSREDVDVVRSYKLGVNAYVVKPVAFEDFAKAVRELGMFWALLNEPPAWSK